MDRVDQHDHLALVLVWPRTSRPGVILGDAHAIRLHARPDTADVAVTVADEIQGLGAGGTLIRTLAEVAQREGITHFSATLLTSNTASQRMLASVGTVLAQDCQGAMREMTVRLPPATTA
ncbi:MAG TPA: GNAT family N-acetyltransferase [Dermatophilaceae bacterium]|nr:GNAT family N-acetyltransferase [Dermatophilaceae bacterium]